MAVGNEKKLNQKNKDLCKGCSQCCNYITVKISEPKTKEDFDKIIWLLMHENVIIYQDPEGLWNMESVAKCKALNKEGLCDIYKERPDICKNYKQEDCDRYSKKPYFIQMFKTREDVLEYVQENTKIRI